MDSSSFLPPRPPQESDPSPPNSAYSSFIKNSNNNFDKINTSLPTDINDTKPHALDVDNNEPANPLQQMTEIISPEISAPTGLKAISLFSIPTTAPATTAPTSTSLPAVSGSRDENNHDIHTKESIAEKSNNRHSTEHNFITETLVTSETQEQQVPKQQEKLQSSARIIITSTTDNALKMAIAHLDSTPLNELSKGTAASGKYPPPTYANKPPPRKGKNKKPLFFPLISYLCIRYSGAMTKR